MFESSAASLSQEVAAKLTPVKKNLMVGDESMKSSVVHQEIKSAEISFETPEDDGWSHDVSASGMSSNHNFSPRERVGSFSEIKVALFSSENKQEVIGESGFSDSSEHLEAVSSDMTFAPQVKQQSASAVKLSPFISCASSDEDKQEKAQGQGSSKLVVAV